jgi:hypothetical protein
MIYYIGNFTQIWHEECIAKSFEDLGVKVFRRQEGKMSAEQIFDDIMEKRHDIDFVLFAKLKIGGDANVLLAKLKREGVKTVCWLFDPYFGYIREYSVDFQPYFKADVVFTTDGGHDKEWKEHNINHICLRQGIYEPEAYMKPAPFEYDIIFVGTMNNEYPYRDKVISFLEATYGDRFKWFGKENSEAVRSHALNDLYGKAKIAIDISVYLESYWSNRFYETMGRGGFLLCNMIEELDKEFTPYKHLAVYTKENFTQLKEVIDYYLSHDEEREKIRLAGFEHTKNNYTYKIRCKTMLDNLKKIWLGV